MSDDKRYHKRFRAAPILAGTNPTTSHMSVLRDVSLSGAFLLNREPPPLGAEIEIRFEEPPLAGYRIKGRVVRHAHENIIGYGVYFPELHPKLLRAFYHAGSA